MGRPTPSAAEPIPNGTVRNITAAAVYAVDSAATAVEGGVIIINVSRYVCGAQLVAFENSAVAGQGQPIARGGGSERNGEVGVVSGYGRVTPVAADAEGIVALRVLQAVLVAHILIMTSNC